MSSKKRKANTKSSKAGASLSDHQVGDSQFGFSNGLSGPLGNSNDAERSPGTSFSGGDNGSASISSAFSPKLVDSASASPLSVNSLSNQGNRISNRIGDSESGPTKTGRADMHQPYADHYGSPPPQRFPNNSGPPTSTPHGSDYFYPQFQQRINPNFMPGFHPSHLNQSNNYQTSQYHYPHNQTPFHQPHHQQSPHRPRLQSSAPSSYASSTPMLTQLLQYPTTKEKPLEPGPGGEYMNNMRHFFQKKMNPWTPGTSELPNQNHLLARMPTGNHNIMNEVQPVPHQQGRSFNQLFQQSDALPSQTGNHTSSSSSSSLQPFNHPPSLMSSGSEAPAAVSKEDSQFLKSSQHSHKKTPGKKSSKSRSRMKRRPDVTKQDISSGDEKKEGDNGGDASDSSSSTEVYSQITPSSTPPATPQPSQTPVDLKNSQAPYEDHCENSDKPRSFPSNNNPYGNADTSRFQPGPNGGVFASQPSGSMLHQQSSFPSGQPSFLNAGQSSARQNPHSSGLYNPYQTSNAVPSKSSEPESYGGANNPGNFRPGAPYQHQQGTTHHGGMVNNNFNAFPRPGVNGPSMPYHGASDPSQPHQPAQIPVNAPPYYRPPPNYQGKPERQYGGRLEFFQPPPGHPNYPGSYHYENPGYRPDMGYRHPSEAYRPEGPYQPFGAYRPDAPSYGGYRPHSHESMMYRHADQQPNMTGHRGHENQAAGSGEASSGNQTPFQRTFHPEKNAASLGNSSSDATSEPAKNSEENFSSTVESGQSKCENISQPLASSAKNNFAMTRTNNQWVTNMQGMMSGGSVVEAPTLQNDLGQPAVPISSVKQMIGGDSFEGPEKDLSSQTSNVSENFRKTPTSQEVPDIGKGFYPHPPHLSRMPPGSNSDFYHSHYRDSPDGRLSAHDANYHRPSSDSRSDTDSKSRGSRPSSTSGKSEYKHKSSERVPSRTELMKQDVYSPSLTPSNHVSMSPASQNDFDAFSPAPTSHQRFSNNPAFSKICGMGHEPERPIFLDRLFSFMNHCGTPITAVPMICKQVIDLYCLYLLVRERGGMIEVTKNKKWRDVSSSLSLGSSSSAGFTLKKNYAKYLYTYECRFDRGGIDPAPFLATLEISSSKKEASKKTTSERIPATSEMDNNSASNSYHDDKESSFFARGNVTSPGNYGSEFGDDSSASQHPHHYGNRSMMSPEFPNRQFPGGFPSNERFDMMSPHHVDSSLEGPLPPPHHGRFPPPPSYRPFPPPHGRYPPDAHPSTFDQRRMLDAPGDGNNYPNQLHGGYWSSHSVPQPYHQPTNYPFFGGPPPHPGIYHQGSFPPRYPARIDMERMQRFGSMAYPPGIRMASFPPGSVELQKPRSAKKRKLNHKDIGPVDPWRLTISLKSGLLCETTWALDVLMVLTRDDQTHSSICLSNMPGMLEVLLEHLKKLLVSIFPKSNEQFEELEISSEVQCSYQKKQRCKNSNLDADDCPNVPSGEFFLRPSEVSELLAVASQKTKRKQSGVRYSNKISYQEKLEEMTPKEWDCYSQLDSCSFDWQMGRSDTSMHIIPAMSDVRDAKDDGMAAAFKMKFFGSRNLSLLSRRPEIVDASPEMLIDDAAKVGEKFEKDDLNVGSLNSVEMLCRTSTKTKTEVTDETCSGKSLVLEGRNKDDAQCASIKIETTIEATNQNELSSTSIPEYLKNPTVKGEGQLSGESCNVKVGGLGHYDRNESLMKAICSMNTFGVDSSNSSTFSCSQIEAVQASCVGDQALIPIEVLHHKGLNGAKRKRDESITSAWDDEVYLPDDGPLCSIGESRREITMRCLCVSTILRNLSFIPSNDVEMSKHCGLILVLGKLLRLKHHHRTRQLVENDLEKNTRDSIKDANIPPVEDLIPNLEKMVDRVDGGDDLKNYDIPNLELSKDIQDDLEDSKSSAESYEIWWWSTVESLRENALVVFANVSGQLDLSLFPEEICIPVLDGLLHWMVCQAGNQDDEDSTSYYSQPNLYGPQHSPLSFRRLVLEALCKLCILDSNVDLLLAVPPFSRILLLFTRLGNLFEERQPLVVREMAVGLLSRLVPADPVVARSLALQRTFIPSILDFLEASIDGRLSTVDSPSQNSNYSFQTGASTSVDVLCRVASILRHISDLPENVALIARYQQRLLHLLTSPALHRTVASVLASVLTLCS